MKKIFLLLFVGLFVTSQNVYAADPAPDISAKSAIVYHADCGRVLYEKQADTKMLIASTTKIMTCLLAIENCTLTERVIITKEMTDVEGSSMYLQIGESYTLGDLLYGLMLASGNDAAKAIAIHIAGDESSFAELMNRKAAKLGMKHTSFENPHGLDSAEHYSTARDMAILAAYAMNHEVFSEIVGTRHTNIKNLTYVNHNKLLWQCEGVIGVKTGYTKAAGRTLVSCCERDGQKLICVTLSAADDWNDHKMLYDWAYGAYGNQILLSRDTVFEVPIMTGKSETVSVEPLTDVTVFAEENSKIDFVIELPRFVFCPVFKGDRAGQIIATIDGTVAAKVPLVYMEDYSLKIENPLGLGQLIQKLRGN